MKLCVCSDIHGNKYSFFKALEEMKKMEIDQFFICGDLCGYYYYHNEVIDAVRNMENTYCILGNHDKLFIDILDGKIDRKFYVEKYGSSIEQFVNNISSDNLEFLRSLESELKVNIDGVNVAMYHGSPWDNLSEYIYPDSDFSRYMSLESDYIFHGHTHYRMHKKIGKLTIVNPGSVGQPRDRKRPSYAVIDTISNTVEFKSIHYDVDKMIGDVLKNAGEPDYLVDVLRR